MILSRFTLKETPGKVIQKSSSGDSKALPLPPVVDPQFVLSETVQQTSVFETEKICIGMPKVRIQNLKTQIMLDRI